MTLVNLNHYFDLHAATLTIGSEDQSVMKRLIAILQPPVNHLLEANIRALVAWARPELATGQLFAISFSMARRQVEIIWVHPALPVWSCASYAESQPLIRIADEPATSNSRS